MKSYLHQNFEPPPMGFENATETGQPGGTAILTDGYENASTQYSAAQMAALIDRFKEKGWAVEPYGYRHDKGCFTAAFVVFSIILFN